MPITELTCVHIFQELSDFRSDHGVRVGTPAYTKYACAHYWCFIKKKFACYYHAIYGYYVMYMHTYDDIDVKHVK